MEAGIFVTALIVVVVALLVWFGIPRYNGRFGKKRLSLASNKITGVNTAKKWREEMLSEADRSGEKELLVKAGEFGQGMVETVESALKRGYNVTVVSGNKTYCKSKEKVKEFLQDPSNTFKYYVLDHRPEDHFAIIGKSHLFIEVPHEWDGRIKDSLGIENARKDILDRFKIKYESTIKTAQKIENKKEDIEFLNGMDCYDDEGNACIVT